MPAPVVLLLVLEYDDIRKTFASAVDAETFVRRYLPLLPDKAWDEDPDGDVVTNYEVKEHNGAIRFCVLAKGT